MRDWLLARLRRGGRRATRDGEEAVADEEKPQLREEEAKEWQPEQEEKEEQWQHDGNGTSAAAAAAAAPLPMPIRRTDSTHSFAESVHTVLTSIHHFKISKWQYRLLWAAIILLAVALGLFLVVSLIYGFGLQVPQVRRADSN